MSCPELSPSGGALIFAGRTASGASEIKLSRRPDGRGATSVTPGSDPKWLRGEEEFLYNIDPAHVAVFALPTMSLSLLPDPGLGGRQVGGAGTTTVSAKGTIGILFVSDKGERVVAVYDGNTLDRKNTLIVPATYEVSFAPAMDFLVLPYQLSSSHSTLTTLDWRTGVSKNVGSYPGFDLLGVHAAGDKLAVLGRHRASDVWSYGTSGRRRLTSDGENFTAALSNRGDLLVSRRSRDGVLNIWWHGRDGTNERLTEGPMDLEPEFSADSKSWVYIAHSQQTIMICSSNTSACRPLRKDDLMPSWPRFSPDGESLAYVTQLGPQRINLVSTMDGKVETLWATNGRCPPVWTSSTSLWSVEESGGHYVWTERTLATRQKTGQQIEIAGSMGATQEIDCWATNAPPPSPFFRRVRVETDEKSAIFELPPSALSF